VSDEQKLPSFMEPSWEYDEPSRIPLAKDLILRCDENHFEFLIAVCRKCRTRTDAQRIELHLAGWSIAVETRIENHEGFMLCPNCANDSYVWEDLY